MGIVGDLPEATVWVFEVGGVAAPRDLLCRLNQRCPYRHCLFDYLVYFSLGCNVVGRDESAEPATLRRYCGIRGQVIPWVQT
jgi:hypothetical protein